MGEIPVLTWPGAAPSAEFSNKLGRAFRRDGFALLKDHNVSGEMIANVFAQADAFFALPIEAKEPLDITRNGQNRGWARQGSESLDEHSGQTDMKEAFNIGLELEADDARLGQPFRALNVWPELDGFRQTLLSYFDQVWRLGVALHGAVAGDLGLKPGFFEPFFSEPMATLRLLHYPAAGGGIGAGAHTDYGSITLLMTDGEPGLQVRPRGGGWVDVLHLPGAFVVNIGDCLMRWTNDTYVSTPHRVVAPKGRRRSIAFFLDPNPDAVIEALPGTGAAKYSPILAADYLRSRLNATYKGNQ